MEIDKIDFGVKICYKCTKINKKDLSMSDKFISVDSNNICYFNKNKTRCNKIPIKSIVNIRYGPFTQTFKNTNENYIKQKKHLCFSIITINRTYDFIGEHLNDTCFIVKTVNRYLEFNKMNQNILDGLFNVLNEMAPENIENGNFAETISDIIKSL